VSQTDLRAQLALAIAPEHTHAHAHGYHNGLPPPPSSNASHSPQHHMHNIDPAIGGDMMSGSPGDGSGDDTMGDGRKGGKRELSQSKRAAQNRAAQVRAFFPRCCVMCCEENVLLSQCVLAGSRCEHYSILIHHAPSFCFVNSHVINNHNQLM